MNAEPDIVIVGGGPAGGCIANLLLRSGRFDPQRIALIEPRLPAAGATAKKNQDLDLRVSALSRASERILRACGVWETLPVDRISTFERMCVWDEGGKADGSGAIRFDCADIGQANLGHIVENSAVQAALLERAREAGVRMLAGQVAALQMQDGAMTVDLQDGLRLKAGLVIAADGADSPTRQMMGIKSRAGTYGQRAIVTHVRCSESHRRTAWQRFLSTGPVALLPLRDGTQEQRCSVVWSTTETLAQSLMAGSEADFCHALGQAVDGVVGRVESCVRRADFPLRHAHAESYVSPRFVLIGDAAHSVHPLAGQGVNLGFLDCAALAQVIDEAGAADIGDLKALRRYERWRKGENLLMLAALDGLNRLFSNDSRPLGLLRRAGLEVVDKMGPLKTRFMRRALGLTGDLPVAAVQ